LQADDENFEENQTILKLDSSIKHTFKFNVEVDPEKVKDIDEVEVNQYSLFLFSQRIIVAILKSHAYCPIELREFLKIVKEEVDAALPEQSRKSVGSFLFLRFFCSAITVPDSYGLIKLPPSQSARRNLVLVAKLLQNLANEVKFGNKEPWMTKFNDFIETNIPKLGIFYDKITKIPKNSTLRTDIPEITSVVRMNSLATLYNQLFLRKKQILGALPQGQDMAEVRKVVEEIIKENGEALIKNRTKKPESAIKKQTQEL